jgi:hypothetical protein
VKAERKAQARSLRRELHEGLHKDSVELFVEFVPSDVSVPEQPTDAKIIAISTID